MTEVTLRPTSDIEKGWKHSTGGGGSGTLHLPVDSLDKGDAIPDEWDEIGVNPFLDTAETANRIETSVDQEQHGYFTYQNSGKSVEDIDLLKCLVSVYFVSAKNNDDYMEVWVHDGSADHYLGIIDVNDVTPDQWCDVFIDYCETHSQPLKDCLNTWAKIDAAKMRTKKTTVETKYDNTWKICYSELWVEWSLARTDYTEVDDDPEGEPSHDSDTTCLTTSGDSSSWEDDLFNAFKDSEGQPFSLPVGNKVDSVKVYGTARNINDTKHGYFLVIIKPNDTKYLGSYYQPPVTYTTYNHEWTTNPETGQPWTESEINALVAGVRGKSLSSCILKCSIYLYYAVKCTQCYVVVSYSPISVAGGILAQIM